MLIASAAITAIMPFFFILTNIVCNSYYPNTTSSTIMSAKPSAKPMVPIFECLP